MNPDYTIPVKRYTCFMQYHFFRKSKLFLTNLNFIFVKLYSL